MVVWSTGSLGLVRYSLLLRGHDHFVVLPLVLEVFWPLLEEVVQRRPLRLIKPSGVFPSEAINGGLSSPGRSGRAQRRGGEEARGRGPRSEWGSEHKQ